MQKNLVLAHFGNTFNIIEIDNEEVEVTAVNIEKDNNGDLWFGTNNAGAFKVEISETEYETVQFVNSESGLNDNNIWSILADKKGDIGFGTGRGGINKLHEKTQQVSYFQYGLPNSDIFNVFEDSEGNFWLGTNGNGLFMLMGDQFSHYTEREGLSDKLIKDIIQDGRGDYWIGTYGGGLVFMSYKNNQAVFKRITGNNNIIPDKINAITIGPEGKIWAGTAGEGIYVYSENKIKILKQKEGLINDYINSMTCDSKGKIWIGTSGGISCYDGKSFINIDEDPNYGLINNEVQTIIEDKNGIIWAGTLGGLVKIDPDKNLKHPQKVKNCKYWILPTFSALFQIRRTMKFKEN